MILQLDATRLPLADQSVDLVCGSPPYCDARTYDDGTLPEGHVVSRNATEWVDWMLTVTREALRVCKGPVIWVAAGVTRDRNYWPACEGLMWEAFKAGIHQYRPVYWHRVGIPGSGGDQWFRADVEYCMGFKHPGPLPWSDNTACGHVPKWAPGGEMSHRLSSGARVNQWGPVGSKRGMGAKNADGSLKDAQRPSHRVSKWGGTVRGKGLRMKDGSEKVYNSPSMFDGTPALANPGNLLKTNTGGGQLGDRLAHENEAPYPERVPEFFIRSLCPPGGTVLDPFGGSGTTAKVAQALGRKWITGDIRSSQVKLIERRLSQVQMELLA